MRRLIHTTPNPVTRLLLQAPVVDSAATDEPAVIVGLASGEVYTMPGVTERVLKRGETMQVRECSSSSDTKEHKFPRV